MGNSVCRNSVCLRVTSSVYSWLSGENLCACSSNNKQREKKQKKNHLLICFAREHAHPHTHTEIYRKRGVEKHADRIARVCGGDRRMQTRRKTHVDNLVYIPRHHTTIMQGWIPAFIRVTRHLLRAEVHDIFLGTVKIAKPRLWAQKLLDSKQYDFLSHEKPTLRQASAYYG